MVSRNKKNISYLYLKNLVYLKYKFKYKLLKSFIHNLTITNYKRLIILFLFQIKLKKNSNFIKNLCLISGFRSSIAKNLFLSRFKVIKKLNNNEILNFNLNTW